MKKMLQKLKKSINGFCYLHFGITILQGRFSLRFYKEFKKDLNELENQSLMAKNKDFPITRLYPCYMDKTSEAGGLSLHYFFQDLHIAQRINMNNPQKHVDIGSRIDGFVAQVASFREIEVWDIRPLDKKISNVTFKQVDIIDEKSIQQFKNYTDSISSLHALEHFGLGRYGDPICYKGFLIGFNNITKLLKKNGIFYFSVPMGEQRIEFHAHRVFSMPYLLDMVSKDYSISSFSYIDDNNNFYENITIDVQNVQSNFNCNYGCAIFELLKK